MTHSNSDCQHRNIFIQGKKQNKEKASNMYTNIFKEHICCINTIWIQVFLCNVAFVKIFAFLFVKFVSYLKQFLKWTMSKYIFALNHSFNAWKNRNISYLKMSSAYNSTEVLAGCDQNVEWCALCRLIPPFGWIDLNGILLIFVKYFQGGILYFAWHWK